MSAFYPVGRVKKKCIRQHNFMKVRQISLYLSLILYISLTAQIPMV